MQEQTLAFPGCFHLRATMSQHHLRILSGEFPTDETSSVCWKQTGHVRKLVQERNHLCAKRASYINIKVQQLGSAEPSRSSICRNNAHA